jgi:hypothetical protein
VDEGAVVPEASSPEPLSSPNQAFLHLSSLWAIIGDLNTSSLIAAVVFLFP